MVLITDAGRGEGRGIALTFDSNIMKKTGNILTVGRRVKEYGFTHIDGNHPPPFTIPDFGG